MHAYVGSRYELLQSRDRGDSWRELAVTAPIRALALAEVVDQPEL
jgi:hypothetical protein